MENTRANFAIGTGWVDLYAGMAITVGTRLTIQNVGRDEIYAVFSATQPVDNRGKIIGVMERFIVPTGVSGVWVKAPDGLGGMLSVNIGTEGFIGAPLDERVYTGLKAIGIQNFLEANVKNSVQWEFSTYNPSLGAGLFQDAVFIVGSKPVIIKSRQVAFSGAGITTQVFESPTYTGGTPINIYNLDRRTPTPPLSTSKVGVTTSATGTEVSAPTYAIGADVNGNKSTGTFNVTGLERVLKPNTTYLLRITNNDSSASRIATYVTFYEGEISNEN